MLPAWNAEVALAVTVALAVLVGDRRPAWQRLVGVAGLALAVGLAFWSRPAAAVTPLGMHFVVDSLVPWPRLLICGMSLTAVTAMRGRDGALTPALALATLGLLLLIQATTLTGLLLGLTLAGVGLTLVRGGAGVTSAVGFAMVAFGGVLWCGLGGDIDFAAARNGLAIRATLPTLAVLFPLALLCCGLLLTVLTPWRSGAIAAPPAAAAWLATAPLPVLVLVCHRLLIPLPTASTLLAVPWVLLALGGLLTVGGLIVALSRDDLTGRLLAAAPAMLGLAWSGLSLLNSSVAREAALATALLAAPVLLAALLLLAGGGPRRLLAGGVTCALMTLAAVPPLPGWRPRLDLCDGLLAGEAWLSCGLVGLGTLLGAMVFLAPLVGLWRDRETLTEPPAINPLGRALAWCILGVALIRGLGFL